MGRVLRMFLAMAIPLAAFGVQMLFWQHLQPLVWFLFYPAVFFSAILTGLGGGILATFLATLLGWYFFLVPRYSFAVDSLDGVLSAVAFAAMGLIFSVFSERLRQLSLRHSAEQGNAQLQEILEQGADAVFVATPDTRLVYANRKACDMLGYQRERLLTLSVADIVAPSGLSRALAQFEQTRVQGQSRGETVLLCHSGATVSVEFNAVRLSDGKLFAAMRDQSELQDMMAALRASEDKFRTLFEGSSDAIVVFANGVFIDGNARAIALFGLGDKSELLNLHPADLSPPWQPDGQSSLVMANVHIAHAFENGTHRFEWLHRRRNGEDFPAEVSIAIIEHQGQQVLQATVHDIGERRRAEDQLRKLSLAVEQSPESIVITDLNARIEYVNDAFVNATGYPRAEVIGQNSRVLQSGNTPPETYGALWQTLSAGRTWQGQFHNRRKDGSEYVEFAIISPIRQADGQISHYLAIKEDITEKRRLAEELEQYRHHLERLVAERTAELSAAHQRLLDTQLAMENVGIGIEWIDVDSGRFRYVNRYAAEMLGYTVDELLELHVSQINPDVPAIGFRDYATALVANGCTQFEADHISKSGQRIPVELSIYYHRSEDQVPQRLIAFVTDISQRRARQQQIADMQVELAHRAEAAEAATRSKSVFLANMSHEIRTPMNAILGLTHLLNNSPLTDEQRASLSKIRGAGEHLLGLINDILDLSKFEAGKLKLESLNFSLENILGEVRGLVAAAAGAKGLEIWLDPLTAPLWLRGDPTRVRQALLNYAGNAVKFTRVGGIHLGCRVLEETDSALLLRFEVRDSGIGVAPENLARLFQAFEQADGSITRKHGGTGLGLAITRCLASLMGGSAGASSEVGVGSTFWFTAWLERGQAEVVTDHGLAPGHAEIRLRHDYAGSRILLAEDDPINQEVSLGLLRSVGLTVDLAQDGAQAVAQLAAGQTYALILMDMQMPKLDGLAATRQIRQLDAGRSIPILALTANAFLEDRERCRAAGMNDFVAKPVDPEVLFGTLVKWLPVPALPPVAPAMVTPEPPRGGCDERQALGARLAALPGLDLEKGLRFVPGGVNRYWLLLREFVRRHGDDMQLLAQHWAKGESQDAERLVHTLKGGAATLGLSQIQTHAAALESALRSDVPALPHRVDELAGALAELTAALAQIDAAGADESA